MSAKVVAEHPDTWTEEDIRQRTAALTEKILALWPRPAGVAVAQPAKLQLEAVPTAVVGEESVEDEDPNVAPRTGKYRQLYWWLKSQDGDELPLTFEQVEQIAGALLPPPARLHPAHWYGYEGSAIARAIRDAGWKATKVDLTAQRLTFARLSAADA